MNSAPVNLYVDRLMQNPPNTAEEVWNATREHSKTYSEAARKVGLTGSEYGEFQQALLDGNAVYIRLPSHVDAMAGLHHGHPYAIKSVTVPANTLGWKVALADGTTVYIPQICGNISVVHGRAIAHHPQKHDKKIAGGPRQIVTQGSTYTPNTPVTFQPPAEASTITYAPAPSTPVYEAPVYVAPVAASGGSVLPFLVPIVAFVGGTIGAVSSPPTTVVPPCSLGSNALGVCQGR